MSIDLTKYQAAASTVTPKQSSAKSKWAELLEKDISFGGSKMSDKQKERFYSELHTLFDSGVDIKTALELLQAGHRSKRETALLQKIAETVLLGESLSEAMARSGKFSPYEYKSIGIGEASGKLLEVLSELQYYFERKIKLRKQFVSAIAYPAFVFAVAIGVVWFMLVMVVPMFSDVYGRFGGDLPALTQFVVDLSETVSAQFKYWLIGLLVIITFLIAQRQSEWYRNYSSAVAMRIPIIGVITRRVYLSRFCQSMHLLIASQTPLVQSIGLIREMIAWYPLEKALEKVQDDLQRGLPLHKSMGQFPDRIFPAQMVALVKVAEEVNQLDKMFEKIGKQYSNEVEHKTGLIGSLLEPIMIVFIALIVGVILIAMYLPMFDLSNKIG